MELPPGLLHVIGQTHLFTDGVDYVILSIPATQIQEVLRLLDKVPGPFTAWLWDKDELTLVLPVATWELSRPTLEIAEESPLYRLITFDLPLELGLTGYVATLIGKIAEQGVSVFLLSAFARDHVLVPVEDFDRAWEALRSFIRDCRAQEILSD